MGLTFTSPNTMGGRSESLVFVGFDLGLPLVIKDSYRYGVLTFTFSIGKGERSES